ncbi:hypothetical protein [Hyalangium rubrum]|uniref:Cytochrome c domain-containing protein n=1 Tax=Hyalangium rubrum TaxID=3103134 RepID=A0ABU5GWP3_9BACT|nr:hypothetical protein [Hyalangium sp. s54d21]MDY7225451.1 hypothetical protein [Hyalangium sp. s54d21]
MGSWAALGGCLLVVACGDSTPTPPGSEADAGVQVPDAGPGNENPSTCSVPSPTSCPEPAPRYADVAPIFERRCVTCHAGTPGGPWSLADYGHVADWQDTIRTNVRDCSMPPPDSGVPMTLEERTAILTWIRCGLPQ